MLLNITNLLDIFLYKYFKILYFLLLNIIIIVYYKGLATH